MRNWQTDFAVFNEDGQLIAIAEANRKLNTDARWASDWLRNFATYQRTPMPPFVLLATPEKLYVWKQQPDPDSFEPIAVTNARRLFSSYTNYDPVDLSKPGFEFIVGAWLDNMSHGLWQPSEPDDVRAFVETGLLEAVQNGRVVAQMAA